MRHRYHDDPRPPATDGVEVVVVGPMKKNVTRLCAMAARVTSLNIFARQDHGRKADAVYVTRDAFTACVVEMA